MTFIEWSELLGNLGEFVAAIAVVTTLIFLTIQIRQNTRALEQSSKQSIASNELMLFVENNRRTEKLFLDEELRDIWQRGRVNITDLTEEEKHKLAHFVNLGFSMTWMEYRLDKAGAIVPRENREVIASEFTNNESVRFFWPHIKTEYEADFVAYIDEIVESLEEHDVPK